MLSTLRKSWFRTFSSTESPPPVVESLPQASLPVSESQLQSAAKPQIEVPLAERTPVSEGAAPALPPSKSPPANRVPAKPVPKSLWFQASPERLSAIALSLLVLGFVGGSTLRLIRAGYLSELLTGGILFLSFFIAGTSIFRALGRGGAFSTMLSAGSIQLIIVALMGFLALPSVMPIRSRTNACRHLVPLILGYQADIRERIRSYQEGAPFQASEQARRFEDHARFLDRWLDALVGLPKNDVNQATVLRIEALSTRLVRRLRHQAQVLKGELGAPVRTDALTGMRKRLWSLLDQLLPLCETVTPRIDAYATAKTHSAPQ